MTPNTQTTTHALPFEFKEYLHGDAEIIEAEIWADTGRTSEYLVLVALWSTHESATSRRQTSMMVREWAELQVALSAISVPRKPPPSKEKAAAASHYMHVTTGGCNRGRT